jgi:glycerol kinase
MNVLAIDQGTTSTKALVVGPGHRVLAEAEVGLHRRDLPGGGVEYDPEELWRSVLEAGRQALDRAGVAVGSVGLANQGESVMAWDLDSGQPLSPIISWQDRRAETVCARLASHADQLQLLTGLPLQSYFAAPKITWVREHLTRDGVATAIDPWLLHRLCRAFVTDAATASRYLLLDLDKTQWSPEACTIFGVDPEALPTIVGCAEVVGETSAFGPPLPVAGLAVDQQAALFAQGCLAEGEAKCTYGTGAFLLANVGVTPRRSAHDLVACVAWRLEDTTTYCLDGQVYSAGSTVDWLQSVGLLASPAELDALAGQVRSGEGVTFVPGLIGLAAPFWQAAARGALVGLSLGTTRAHLVRAVVEGIAAHVALLAKVTGDDLGRPLQRLRVDGGLTRSKVLMQVQADLAQIPVEVYPNPHATTLGAAALARLGTGEVADAAAATGGWSPAATYLPQVPAGEAAERLEGWRQVVEAQAGVR